MLDADPPPAKKQRPAQSSAEPWERPASDSQVPVGETQARNRSNLDRLRAELLSRGQPDHLSGSGTEESDEELGPRVKRSRVDNEDDVADLFAPESEDEGDAVHSIFTALTIAGVCVCVSRNKAMAKAQGMVSP